MQSAADVLPFPVAGEAQYPEETRLRYRYLDLRRDKIHRNMLLRAGVIASLRRRMIDAGFTEFQTPILTASSPEGARDFLVPSRTHPRHLLRPPARRRSNSSNSPWSPASTATFRLRPASAMRQGGLTAHPASSTNSISK